MAKFVGGVRVIRDALGFGPPRTIEDMDKLLLRYFEQTGKCPTSDSHNRENTWLGVRGTSIYNRCIALGLPTRNKERTMETVTGALIDYYKATGKRPTAITHPNEDGWLRKYGSSVSKRCTDLDMPPSPFVSKPDRTRESIEAEIREYFAKTGERPTKRDLRSQNDWLQERGSSLHKLCNELGLPGGPVLNRTRESIEADIREHFTKTGERPSKRDLPNQNAWLRERSSSLSKLCDELGLPKAGTRNDDLDRKERCMSKETQHANLRTMPKEAQSA